MDSSFSSTASLDGGFSPIQFPDTLMIPCFNDFDDTENIDDIDDILQKRMKTNYMMSVPTVSFTDGAQASLPSMLNMINAISDPNKENKPPTTEMKKKPSIKRRATKDSCFFFLEVRCMHDMIK